ncbi:dirigent protein 23-like [Cryptomeria japonica]|uniref:dirigent protein 23-like n=1 Tax=Cryptomeria japonica TaxID=3369 RepID=UPI0027D9E8C8|nr:dirigent protein 23-like [Cryptomeria japonica]
MGKKNLAAVAVVAIVTMLSLQASQAYLLKEKISHLQFYFHDKVEGKNVTAVLVASAPTTNTSSTFFGGVVVIDDLLTEGPEPTSKLVGRAQGLYAAAGQEELRLLMAVTYVFQGGKFNGSTLSVVGNNAVFNKVREMPIVGGSGKFRLARGYALAQTHFFDLKSGNAIVHYNVTVYHY